MAGNTGLNVVMDGLVFYYDGANTTSYPGSGTVLTDLSSYGNNGTLNNSPGFSSDKLGGIVFDGTNDYITMSDSTSLRPSTTLSLDVCFKMTTKGIYNTVICKPATAAPWSSPFLSYMLRVQTNELQFGYNGDSNYSFVNHTNNYLINTIYHVILTYNLSTGACKFYLNGTNVVDSTTTTGTAITYGAQPLLLGAGFGSSPVGELFTGTIYSAKVYNRVLTANESLQNYYAIKNRFNI